jgi:hypothetical protein
LPYANVRSCPGPEAVSSPYCKRRSCTGTEALYRPYGKVHPCTVHEPRLCTGRTVKCTIVQAPRLSTGRTVKCTIVQAPRLCTGRTAHRGSKDIAVPFHDHGTRKGWEVSVTPWLLLTPGKTRYPLYRRLGGPQGRCGQVWKISPPPGFEPRIVQPVASRYLDCRLTGGPSNGYSWNLILENSTGKTFLAWLRASAVM